MHKVACLWVNVTNDTRNPPILDYSVSGPRTD